MSTFFFANKTPPPTFFLKGPTSSTPLVAPTAAAVEATLRELVKLAEVVEVWIRWNNQIQPVDFWVRNFWGWTKIGDQTSDGEELGGVEELFEVMKRISFLFLGELFQGIARA